MVLAALKDRKPKTNGQIEMPLGSTQWRPRRQHFCVLAHGTRCVATVRRGATLGASKQLRRAPAMFGAQIIFQRPIVLCVLGDQLRVHIRSFENSVEELKRDGRDPRIDGNLPRIDAQPFSAVITGTVRLKDYCKVRLERSERSSGAGLYFSHDVSYRTRATMKADRLSRTT